MPDGFVPLDEFFAQPAAAAAAPEFVAPQPTTTSDGTETLSELSDVLAEVRRFRAALADAFDASLADLLHEIACAVLARELSLAPVDVAALAASAFERFAAENPLSVRAHPEDVTALAPLGFATIADSSLRRGDLVLELDAGTIDASLGARLETVLARR